MGLFRWRGAVPDAEAAAARAAEGAAYLDAKFGPRWDQTIELDQLDIGSFSCVLGQLGRGGMWCFPTPWRAVKCGFSCGLLADVAVLTWRPPTLARSYGLLTEAWKELIAERRREWAETEALAQRAASRRAEEEAPASVAGGEGAPSHRRAPRRGARGKRPREAVPCG
jgi:hypothetical protein